MLFLKRVWIPSLFFAILCSSVNPSLAGARQSRFQQALETNCIGPENARFFMIYLHGMDSKKIGLREELNRKALASVAAQLNVRIAVPRAREFCPGPAKELCWFVDASTDLSSIWSQISESRKSCFSEQVPFGVLGFSNGGYFLSHWFRKGCPHTMKASTPSWMIASGSARGDVSALSSDGSTNFCPRFKFMIGDSDRENHDPTFLKELSQKLPLEPTLIFEGEHEINIAATTEAIEAMIRSQD